jgi:hypothetical protein
MSKVMAVARSCGVVRARTRLRDNVTQVPEVLLVFFGISIINLYVPTVSMEFQGCVLPQTFSVPVTLQGYHVLYLPVCSTA